MHVDWFIMTSICKNDIFKFEQNLTFLNSRNLKEKLRKIPVSLESLKFHQAAKLTHQSKQMLKRRKLIGEKLLWILVSSHKSFFNPSSVTSSRITNGVLGSAFEQTFLEICLSRVNKNNVSHDGYQSSLWSQFRRKSLSVEHYLHSTNRRGNFDVKYTQNVSSFGRPGALRRTFYVRQLAKHCAYAASRRRGSRENAWVRRLYR